MISKAMGKGKKDETLENIRLSDQANKSTGWMPGHQTPTKDAISCDKPWGAANGQ